MSTVAGDGSYPTADLDRRFYAFALDRLLAWTVYAVAVWAAWVLFLDDGRIGPGIAVIAVTVVVVTVVLSFVLGLLGTSPGKAALGLRVVDAATGRPIGVGPALLRTTVLGVATLPTLGLGVAGLAFTSLMDGDHQRRGWHDHQARSVVVDVRPAPPEEDEAAERPRQIVNLTAMRLVPASPTPPREVPARVRRSRWAAGPTHPAPAATTPSTTSSTTSSTTPPTVTTASSAPPAIALSGDLAPAAPLGAPLTAAVGQPASAPAPAVAPAAAADPAPAVMDQAPPPVVADPAMPVVADQQPEVVPDPDALRNPDRPAVAARATPSRRAEVPPATGLGDRLVAQPGEPAAPRHSSAAPAPARPARWSVSFDTGEVFVVDGFTLVGRNPEPRPGEPVRRLVPLPSQDMSLSKTHAQFQVVPDGALVVMDRGSTNGSLLIRAGVTRELGPGRPAALRDGDVVRFGDREMRVAREA